MLNQTLRRLERDGLVEPQGLPRRSPEGRIRPDTARQTAHRLASGGKWADQYLHKLEEARASDDNGRARQRLEVASGSGLQILTLVSNRSSARQQFAGFEPPEEREGPPGEVPPEPIHSKNCEWLGGEKFEPHYADSGFRRSP